MTIAAWENKTIYDGYALTATTNYVYNDGGSTAATSGWIKVRYDDVVVQLAVATLAATTFSYIIEGRIEGFDRPSEIYSSTATAAMTIDKLINVTERVMDIRVGVKVDNAATPNVVYTGIVMSERK